MDDKILDDGYVAKVEIKNKNDIKKLLRHIGINSFYEHKNGTIIVEKSDAVKIAIHYENDTVSIKPKFPRIGNSVQVLFTAIILGIFVFLIRVPFPFQWIFAFVGGQIISYLIHAPKTKKLKEKIEQYI